MKELLSKVEKKCLKFLKAEKMKISHCSFLKEIVFCLNKCALTKPVIKIQVEENGDAKKSWTLMLYENGLLNGYSFCMFDDVEDVLNNFKHVVDGLKNSKKK